MNRIITKPGIFDLSKNHIETLIIKASNVFIKNLKMNCLVEKSIQVIGNNVKLQNCCFIENDEKANTCIEIKGKNCRFTNCLFENFQSQSDRLVGVEDCCIININSISSYCLINSCNFREIKCDIIKIGNQKTYKQESKTMIYDNFFNQCSGSSIIIESSLNVISHNKFIQCDNSIILKNGYNNRTVFNYINDCNGISISGSGHVISYNTIEAIGNIDDPEKTAISLLCGNQSQPTNNIEISNNDFLGCEVAFSLGVTNEINQLKPTNIHIFNNRIVKVIKMINKNEKCLGIDNSKIEDNPIIEKDIKIEIEKALDIGEDNVIFYNTIYMEKERAPKDINKKKVKKKKTHHAFKDLIEEIERLQKRNKKNKVCSKCNEYKIIINEYKTQMRDINDLLF